jgi:hypothetical protein
LSKALLSHRRPLLGGNVRRRALISGFHFSQKTRAIFLAWQTTKSTDASERDILFEGPGQSPVYMMCFDHGLDKFLCEVWQRLGIRRSGA